MIKRPLLSEELIVGAGMVALAFANYDGRTLPRGTASYLLTVFDGGFELLNALILVCGVALVLFACRHIRARPLDFALLTFPLAVFIVGVGLYTAVSGGAKSALVIDTSFYVLLLWRVLDRKADAHVT